MDVNHAPACLRQLANEAYEESLSALSDEDKASISIEAAQYAIQICASRIQEVLDELSNTDLLLGYYQMGGR